MKFPTAPQRNESRDSAAMTPMIDIVFLLLIFFVCAATGQTPELQLATDLAGGSVESIVTPPEQADLGEVWLRLKTTESGRPLVEVNNREYGDFETLQQTLMQLAGLAPEIPVILDIEPEVPLGIVIQVYDTCRAAKFESIHFATEPRR